MIVNGKDVGSAWIAAGVRKAIYFEDGGRCVCCGSSDKLTLDHAKPRSKSGALTDPRNLVTMCHKCNSLRRALSYPAFVRFCAEVGIDVKGLVSRVNAALKNRGTHGTVLAAINRIKAEGIANAA